MFANATTSTPDEKIFLYSRLDQPTYYFWAQAHTNTHKKRNEIVTVH